MILAFTSIHICSIQRVIIILVMCNNIMAIIHMCINTTIAFSIMIRITSLTITTSVNLFVAIYGITIITIDCYYNGCALGDVYGF